VAARLSLTAYLALADYLADESGATAIEYGMIAALVFLVVVTSLTACGNKTTAVMQNISNAVGGAIG
jgi:pilus assembly protein Flp/PilA